MSSLMNQVAEITESRTFNVPGGQSVSAYRDGLYPGLPRILRTIVR